ncbi:hypothetical protein BRADI_2g43054v3 [Brachypodium distachyon]|uniref:Uncharacterized protein n=1 Tax=Brachypodium distachyon TaxID=15368 RepID=A0A2K2DDK7_BRADI|nr:hypothetical protein BRADI_2g43054v3 [Brachypodium distachyon]
MPGYKSLINEDNNNILLHSFGKAEISAPTNEPKCKKRRSSSMKTKLSCVECFASILASLAPSLFFYKADWHVDIPYKVGSLITLCSRAIDVVLLLLR